MSLTLLIPGQVVPLCRGCVHQWTDLSHPTPCTRVRWEGHRHVKPQIERTDNGITCSDFVPAAVQPGATTAILEGILG